MAWAQTGALLRRLWPQTLSGRMALILVAGMLAAQALTGTIWWESRRSQLLEVPLRLLGARAADSLLLLSSLPPEARAAAVGTLSTQGYQLALLDGAQARHLMDRQQTDAADAADVMAGELLADVLARRVGAVVPFHLLALELHGGALLATTLIPPGDTEPMNDAQEIRQRFQKTGGRRGLNHHVFGRKRGARLCLLLCQKGRRCLLWGHSVCCHHRRNQKRRGEKGRGRITGSTIREGTYLNIKVTGAVFKYRLQPPWTKPP